MAKTQKQKLHDDLYVLVDKYPNMRVSTLVLTTQAFLNSIFHAMPACVMPHPAYDLYHPFEGTGKRCGRCFGLREDQFHATNAQSTTTSPAHPIQNSSHQTEGTLAEFLAPKVQARVPGSD